MPRAPESFAGRLGLIAVAGAALRAFSTFVINPHQLGFGDWVWYHSVANQIASGAGFADPFARAAGEHVASASHPPLYPLVLTPISLLGGTSDLAHRSLGILLGALGIALMGLLGRRVAGSATVGLVTAALTAIYPVFIAADGALLSETLYTPLLAGTLLAAYGVRDQPTVRRSVALGVLVALCALTRSEALLLLPLLAVPVAWGARAGRPLRLAAAVVAFAVVLAPWTIRNADVFGRLVPVSTQDGALIAGANCARTYAGPDMGGWAFDCLARKTSLNEATQSDIWRKQGVDYARDHAGRVPAVLGMRLLKLADVISPRYQLQFAEGRNHKVQAAGIAMYYLLVPLALFGALLLRRRGQPLYLLAAPVITVIVATLGGYGVTRLRHAADMVIVICAAVALTRLAELARARRSARTAPAGGPQAATR